MSPKPAKGEKSAKSGSSYEERHDVEAAVLEVSTAKAKLAKAQGALQQVKADHRAERLAAKS